MTIRAKPRARPGLAALLKQAARDGEVKIKSKDGETFVIRPERRTKSPLDIEGVDLKLTRAEIIEFIHESRKNVFDK